MNSTYAARRSSEIPWVDDLPAHWDVQPLLAVARERTEPNLGMREDNLLSLSYGRIVPKDIASNDGLLPESFETYQIVEPGDVVLRLTDLQNDKRSLRSGLVATRGIITSAYAAVAPFAVDASYLSHLLRAYDLTKVFYSMGGGLRQSMKYSDMRRLPIILPPMSEQVAIAAFLDRETGKIDALVEEQRRLIELLREKRQAVISHAVTKGLDPDAKLRPSGVEWLGDIPERWRAAKLNRLATKIVDGAHFTPTYVPEGVPFLRVTDITRPKIDLDEVKRIPLEEHLELSKRCRPERGDLLLSKNGTIGVPKVVTWDWEFSIFVSLCLIKLTAGLDTAYASYVFQSRSIESQIEEGSKQSTVTNLHLEKIAAFLLPVPPIEEQKEIVAWLDEEVMALDALTDVSSRAAKLLEERRSALISAAVTGKIEVREAATTGAEAA